MDIIKKGILYNTIDSTVVDLFLIKFIDESNSLEFLKITDSTIYNEPNTVELFINFPMHSIDFNKDILYKDNKNIKYLIDTMIKDYSTMYSGMRMVDKNES